jgi:hypothetical protein
VSGLVFDLVGLVLVGDGLVFCLFTEARDVESAWDDERRARTGGTEGPLQQRSLP